MKFLVDFEVKVSEETPTNEFGWRSVMTAPALAALGNAVIPYPRGWEPDGAGWRAQIGILTPDKDPI